MKPLPHRYDVRLTGGPSGYAALATDGVSDLRSAPPVDFGGPGDAWSPEHLLLAAVETCFLFTLREVARASRLEFTALELSAESTVDRTDGVLRFSRPSWRRPLSRPPRWHWGCDGCSRGARAGTGVHVAGGRP